MRNFRECLKAMKMFGLESRAVMSMWLALALVPLSTASAQDQDRLELIVSYTLSPQASGPTFSSLRTEHDHVASQIDALPSIEVVSHRPLHRALTKKMEETGKSESMLIAESAAGRKRPARSALPAANSSTKPFGLSRRLVFSLRVDSNVDQDRLVKDLPALVQQLDPGLVIRVDRETLGDGAIVPNDPFFSEQWGLQVPQDPSFSERADIDAALAWDTTLGSSEVMVAVIDTGVANHPELADRIALNQAELTGLFGIDDDGNGYVDDIRGWDFVETDHPYCIDDCTDPDADPSDAHGHGTHVAGIIAAFTNNSQGIAGVAPGVKILPVRALFGTTGGGSVVHYSTAAEALLYAVLSGADVVNMSFGSYSEWPLTEEIALAREFNVTLIAAAGNGNTDTQFYPAFNREVIAVGATNQLAQRASFSNFGDWVDVSAPGIDILSLYRGTGYTRMSGTSMSAPFVSGVAALVKSRFPSASAAFLRHHLLASAASIDDLNPGFEGKLGRGIVNAGKAMTELHPFFTVAETIIDDDQIGSSSGNGNKVVDQGETVELGIVVRNSSPYPVQAGSVRFVSANPEIVLENSRTSHQFLAPNATFSIAPTVVQVASTHPSFSSLEIDIEFAQPEQLLTVAAGITTNISMEPPFSWAPERGFSFVDSHLSGNWFAFIRYSGWSTGLPRGTLEVRNFASNQTVTIADGTSRAARSVKIHGNEMIWGEYLSDTAYRYRLVQLDTGAETLMQLPLTAVGVTFDSEVLVYSEPTSPGWTRLRIINRGTGQEIFSAPSRAYYAYLTDNWVVWRSELDELSFYSLQTGEHLRHQMQDYLFQVYAVSDGRVVFGDVRNYRWVVFEYELNARTERVWPYRWPSAIEQGWALSRSAYGLSLQHLPTSQLVPLVDDYTWLPYRTFDGNRVLFRKDNDSMLQSVRFSPPSEDNCPSDPFKVAPGQCGCGVRDVDDDRDGVANCVDSCPADGSKASPGQCGCGIPDEDHDGDGVVSCIDSCPADGSKASPGQCGCGVPDLDHDGDGVVSCIDSCPNDGRKTSPGQCGCGLEDIDEDLDGLASCSDTCPLDPAKDEPGVCGCGTQDSDVDADAQIDCEELASLGTVVPPAPKLRQVKRKLKISAASSGIPSTRIALTYELRIKKNGRKKLMRRIFTVDIPDDKPTYSLRPPKGTTTVTATYRYIDLPSLGRNASQPSPAVRKKWKG